MTPPYLDNAHSKRQCVHCGAWPWWWLCSASGSASAYHPVFTCPVCGAVQA